MIDHLFLSHTHVQQVLVDVYEDLLDFHKRAIVFFKQGGQYHQKKGKGVSMLIKILALHIKCGG